MRTRKHRFERWIEEAEARRLSERAVLEPDARSPRAAAPAAIAAAVHLLRSRILQPRTRPQTRRDGCPEGSL